MEFQGISMRLPVMVPVLASEVVEAENDVSEALPPSAANTCPWIVLQAKPQCNIDIDRGMNFSIREIYVVT